MNILILYLEPNLQQMVQEVLEREGYTVTAVQQASEAIHILEEYSDAPFLLLADNIHMNAQALEFLQMLAERPELRRRVRVIAETAVTNLDHLRDVSGNLIDDFLMLPFSVDQLIACIETNAAKLAE